LQVADILKLIYKGGGDRANSAWQFGKSSNGMPLVRIHFIIVMIRWTGLAPWEFEFPFLGSLTSN